MDTLIPSGSTQEIVETVINLLILKISLISFIKEG